ncbi:MAG: NADH-quinone oxidoreductase subunit N [Ignavibacteria bacterium]|nr:NADH-quinone oxidoreductase subunit N [Ignavibacteria bacterium]MCU7503416.1 NADH-quinone oxidoreductase subunit N [Ignavibacteria bacterium]MCU7516252.1 NADH-quinone oxidoreductase subunit N [Ignavibacteria bacterium]
MTSADLYYLMPLIIIAGASVVMLLVIGFYRDHTVTFILSILGLAGAFISLAYIRGLPREIGALVIVDSYALFYWGLITLASLAVAILSYGYFSKMEEEKEEYYVLLLTATLGSLVLVVSRNFVSFFMGLEILSVSLYALVAYLPERKRSVEAGIKYLVLAAASSAFLLFGMALVYAESGTMDFLKLGAHLNSGAVNTPLILAGFALMVIAVGFKLALAPFHMWTPDVYEGAPAPVTAFVATVSKGGMFALWFRFFTEVNGYRFNSLMILFTVIAIASMFIGNFLALLQNNVKRILAYSSIAHLGYLLIAFLAGGRMGLEAGTFYLVAYFITTLGTFGIVTVLSFKERDADSLDDYRALYWRRPLLATAFTAMLMSLAGIPLTAGFVGKFYLAAAGVNTALWLPVIILVINSAISVYYYLKIVVVMYRSPEEEVVAGMPVMTVSPALSVGGGIVLSVLTIMLVWFGTFPGGIIDFIKIMISGISSTAITMVP